VVLAPAARVKELARTAGEGKVTDWAGELLTASVVADDPDYPSIVWLGGAHAQALINNNQLDDPTHRYWVRVWAARALLHLWSPAQATAVVSALGDDAWRVREMAAKVARKHEVGEAAEALAALVGDPQPRVRAASALAIGDVGEAEHADVLLTLTKDPDDTVSTAATRGLERLEKRLDRPLR
jgi:HEAT repeat protein